MVGAIVFAFLVGVSVGFLVGRRAPRPEAERAAAASAAPVRAEVAGRPAPTKRGRKAGLTEESFTPSDDILEKLRLAAEGGLDPAVLADEPPRKPAPEEPAERPPPEVDPRLAEAEQRVLDRLRRQAGHQD